MNDGAEQQRDPLLDRLADMWTRRDPMPAELDAEVLALIDAQSVIDGVVMLELISDQDRLAGVRGGAERTLRFASPNARAELVIRLIADATGTRIDGWLVPAEAGTITLTIRDRVHDTPVDAAGRFVFTGVPDGDATLRWSTDDADASDPEPAVGWTTAAFTI